MRNLIARKPPTRRIVKTMVNILKYLSINLVIGSPNFHINNDTRKNLAERLTVEAKRKVGKLILNAPDEIVNILNGIGVNPAVNTMKKLLSSY